MLREASLDDDSGLSEDKFNAAEYRKDKQIGKVISLQPLSLGLLSRFLPMIAGGQGVSRPLSFLSTMIVSAGTNHSHRTAPAGALISIFFWILSLLLPSVVVAGVSLPSVFGDHMV